MLRMVAAFVSVFALVLVILFATVGQLGKIDRQTLVVVLAAAAIAAVVAALRARRGER